MSAPHEVEMDRIRDAYARRTRAYPPLSAWVLAIRQERERALAKWLLATGRTSLAGLEIAELGCGSGGNLLDFIRLGAEPSRLTGNDLLEERVEAARRVLPPSVTLVPGDAAVAIPGASRFDIVFQSMMCSSILDDEVLRDVCATMWRLARPGGGVLWYDFVVNNPSNPDVRGMSRSAIRGLFPEGRPRFWRLTLAPPLARVATAIHPVLYPMLNSIPLLRSHVLCWIPKR
jgi:SAM-dependent methyltransferase